MKADPTVDRNWKALRPSLAAANVSMLARNAVQVMSRLAGQNAKTPAAARTRPVKIPVLWPNRSSMNAAGKASKQHAPKHASRTSEAWTVLMSRMRLKPATMGVAMSAATPQAAKQQMRTMNTSHMPG